MTSAQANGITIEYEVLGEGEPLLLVMGLGGQLVAWPLELVERLIGRGFQVIRFDNRDVGLSTHLDAPVPTNREMVQSLLARRFVKAPYLLADMANDAVGLLDHLGIESAHVVGASMGGMIGQTLAIEHPGRVRSLTSVMSNTGDRRHGRIRPALLRQLPRLMNRDEGQRIENGVALGRMIAGPHFDEAASRRQIAEALARSYDRDGTARHMLAVAASPDRTAALGAVRAPTLVIHGLVDPLVSPSGGIATARAVPGSRLVMYPDMGHDLPVPRWDETVDAIVTNCARAQVGASSTVA